MRNGILAYRPTPEVRLEPILGQQWAKDLRLDFGTRRFPPEWLEHHLHWRDRLLVKVSLLADSVAGSFSTHRH